MSTEKCMETVYIASSQPEAYIVKGRLEADGIPVMLKYESLGIVYGITVDGLGEIQIQVPADEVGRARELLDSDPESI